MANEKKIPNPFDGLDPVSGSTAAQPAPAASSSAPNPFAGMDDAPAPSRGYGIADFGRDLGVTAAKGVIGAGESLVGLADIPTLGRAGKALSSIGYDPKAAKEQLDSYRSDALNQSQREVDSVDGFTDTAKAYLSHPGALTAAAGEAIPSMLGGGAVSRGVLKVAPKLAGIAAGIGEGAISAGQTAEQVRQDTASGDLTLGQTAIAAGSGALTGALGAAAGKVSRKLGIAEFDEMLAGVKPAPGEASSAAKKGVARKIAEGALTEGVLEELPQSSQEQVAQNLAEGKPWNEGVGKAAAAGAIIGAAMGAGSNAVEGIRSRREAPAPNGEEVANPAAPVAQNPAEIQPAPDVASQDQAQAPATLTEVSDQEATPDSEPQMATTQAANVEPPSPVSTRSIEPEQDIFGHDAPAQAAESPTPAVEAAAPVASARASVPPAAAALAAEAANPSSVAPAAARGTVKVNGQEFTLNEEQAKAWAEADANHARTLAALNPAVYPRSVIDKVSKQAGMQLSAKRRQITGALTDKEKLAAAVDAARIRPGDAVQARVGDQDISGTVQGLRYGKVRIDTGGELGVVEVPHASVSKPNASANTVTPEPAVQAIPPNVQAGSAVNTESGTVTIANSVANTVVTLDPKAGPMSAAAVTGELANGSISKAQQQAAAVATQEQASAQPAEPTFHADGVSAREQASRLETSTGTPHVALPTVDDQGNRGYRAAPAAEAGQVYGKDAMTDHAAVMELAAAKDATPQKIERLAQSGADLNAIGENGRTPLTSFIEEGDTKAAARLARAGADLEAVDGKGYTPLQLALATNNNALASALVRSGASLDRVVSMAQRDAEGNLPKPVQALVDQAAMRDMFTPKDANAPANAPKATQEASKAPAASEGQGAAAKPAETLQSAGGEPPTIEGDRQTHTREQLAGRIEKIFNDVKSGLGTDLLRVAGFNLESATDIGGIGPRTFGVTEIQGGKSNVRIPFDNIPLDWSDDRIKGLVMHEVAVHAAQLGKSLPGFVKVQKDFLRLMKAGDKKALAALARVPLDTDPRYQGEEALAYYIEMNPKSSMASDIVEWFRQALRSLTKGLSLKETGRFNQWVNGLSHAELLKMATESLIQHIENSPKRGDETASRGGERLFSQGQATPADPNASPASVSDAKAELSKTQKAKLKYVDKFDTMRKLVRKTEARLGIKIPDKYNPSLAQDRASSVAGEQTRQLDEKLVDPLLHFLRDKKISLDTLSDYLQARHAPERNAEMKRINPNRADNEALSGMSNEQSAQILGVNIAGMSAADAKAKLDATHPDLQKAAGMVEAIIADNRDRTVKAGIETKETIDAWDAKYDFYVPLKREGFDDILKGNGPRNGTGGSLSREAAGSDRPVENVVAHAILDAKKTINRAAQNDAVKVMAAFAKKYLNSDVARLVKPTEIAGDITSPEAGDTTQYGLPQKQAFTIDGDGNIVEARLQDDPRFADKPNFVAYRVGGKDYAIEFNQESPTARSIAAAYTGANDIKADADVVKWVGKITRYISQINTSLNPFFGVKNVIRDTGHAAIALESTPLAGKQAQLLKNQVLGTKAVFAELSGAKPGSIASQNLRAQFNRFRELGGKMEFSKIYANAEDQVQALNKQLNKDWFLDNAVGKGLEKVKLDGPVSAAVDMIVRPATSGLNIWNEGLENGTRFAIYLTGIQNGMSEAQAISLAQNLTVNFGRKGTDTSLLSAFYGFFNASIQGTAAVGRTIFDTDKPGPFGLPFSLTPAGKKIIVGGILAGVAQAALLAAAGFDDDEINENDASKNILLPIGGKKYMRIPMPQGFLILPTIGRQLFNATVYGKPLDRVGKTIAAVLDGFSPIGQGGTVSQTLAPTFLDPFVQLTENKDFAGNQIARQDMSGDNPTPGHTRSKDSATAFSKWASQALNSLTGGTDYKPGAVSPTPDQVDFLLGALGGGIFREGQRILSAGESFATGEDLDPSKMPIASGYYANADSNGAVSGRYHEAVKEINAHKLEVEGRKKNGGDVSGYYAENPEARLIPFAQNIEGQVKKLGEARKKATARGDKERVRELGEQIAEAQRRLIERFKEEK